MHWVGLARSHSPEEPLARPTARCKNFESEGSRQSSAADRPGGQREATDLTRSGRARPAHAPTDLGGFLATEQWAVVAVCCSVRLGVLAARDVSTCADVRASE
jgi:hypothetical protein